MFETILRDTETIVSHCALKILLPANRVQIQAITTTSDSVKNGCAMPDVIFPRAPIGILLSSARIVQVVTNQAPGLNIVTGYAINYILPGHAIVNVTFKTYGYITNVQTLTFVSDLKIGHYMKIPPRFMFFEQLISTFVASSVNLATSTWLINTRDNICTPVGYLSTCRNINSFYSVSIIWGAIGLTRVFGNRDGALYSKVQ